MQSCRGQVVMVSSWESESRVFQIPAPLGKLRPRVALTTFPSPSVTLMKKYSQDVLQNRNIFYDGSETKLIQWKKKDWSFQISTKSNHICPPLTLFHLQKKPAVP